MRLQPSSALSVKRSALNVERSPFSLRLFAPLASFARLPRTFLACALVIAHCASLTTTALQAADPALPKIRIISVGGTIDSTAKERLNLSEYGGEGNPRKPVQEMVNELPELKAVADVSVEEDILPRGGPGRTMATVLKVAKRVNEIFAKEPDIAGVVITQGTNNLEESAFFLHLTVQSKKPSFSSALNAPRPHSAATAGSISTTPSASPPLPNPSAAASFSP